ncbi:hypothetical protein K491DRAFT_696432 [Lophiostoma macrostomum CBS 122681]|uniref:Uncharacterized protein n=1 Tax=Lophiostoma macrostomum CBS 122681 TaxID=1314788 RepID=A0A6A6SXX7_9PLEO|nr:hypothetical protein K491DRAFT_696432 [Lophiostoma macrostomum CBS 122681]
MASATVIPGLMPSMIALLGPSVTELSLLSTRSPLLAVLLALASPGVNLTHLFRGPHLQESRVIGASTSATMREFYFWYNQRSRVFKLSLRAVESLVVGVMIANTITVSIDLDLCTVSGWRCGQMYMPLM